MIYNYFLSFARSIAVSLAALVVLAALPGCSGEGGREEKLPTAGVCAAGEEAAPGGGCICPAGTLARESGGCQPAGLPPDMACPPGEMLLAGGGCQAAGVPPEACAVGFAPDNEGGCAPILPAKACPKGLMAVPGETACREVAVCGDGDYGDIPVDLTSEHVNGAYQGSESDGTPEKPWKTIQEGVDAAEPGDIVAVAAGTYIENVSIFGKPVRLWGRCPSLVEIKGPSSLHGAVDITTGGAAGTELRGVALTGNGSGVVVSEARGVLIDRIWSHKTRQQGVYVYDFDGAPEVTLTGALIEETNIGIWLEGAQAVIESTVVRNQRDIGFGIYIAAMSYQEVPTKADIRSSVVERAIDVGIYNLGGVMTLEATVVKDTQPTKSGHFGWGIYLDALSKAQRASGTIKSSVVMENHHMGIIAEGADVSIETTTVTDTILNNFDPECAGIGLLFDMDTGRPAIGTIRSSKVARSRGRGITIVASEGTIEATLISQTLVGANKHGGGGLVVVPEKDRSSSLILRASIIDRAAFLGIGLLRSNGVIEGSIVRDVELSTEDRYEIGIYASSGLLNGEDEKYLGARSNLIIRSSLLERTRAIGVVVEGADVTIETSTIKNPEPDGDVGFGIFVMSSDDDFVRGNLVVRSSLVEQAVYSGVRVDESDALIEGSVIKGTQADAANLFGDGIIVTGQYGDARGTLTLRDTRIESSQRAGVANFGSTVLLERASMLCNTIDINGEALPENGDQDLSGSFDFDDLGGTACGCPAAKERCRVLSSKLTPPKNIDPDPEF